MLINHPNIGFYPFDGFASILSIGSVFIHLCLLFTWAIGLNAKILISNDTLHLLAYRRCYTNGIGKAVGTCYIGTYWFTIDSIEDLSKKN